MSPFCPACGGEVDDDMQFCPECGADLRGEADTDDEAEAETPSAAESEAGGWRRYLPGSWQIAVAGLVMGLVAGGLVAWGLANIGGSAAGFFLGFVVVTLYLWQKPTGVGALGSGCYIAAILLVLVPLFFYGPMIGASEDPQTAEEIGMAAGSILGLFIWTVVFAIIAAVIGVVGYFLKRRQKGKLES